MDIKTFLSVLTNIDKVIQLVDQLLERYNRQQGQKHLLLLELKQNIATIDLYVKNQTPIEEVILNLRTGQLKKALESNLNFNAGRVTERMTGEVPYFRKYTDWNTNQLFENLYIKITELQDIVRIDPNNPNIRLSVRLYNILKLIKLILLLVE